MIYDGLICSSCGANNVVNTNGQFVCSYCHAIVVPRFIPGSGCFDIEDGAFCSKPAESICTACARPICDQHNNQKTIYWQELVNWRSCCPQWDDAAGKAWEIVTNQPVSLPVAGFNPSPWYYFEKDVLCNVGEIEWEIAAAIKAIVNPIGGDFYETGVRFPSICSFCEAETGVSISQAIDPFRDSYRRVAYHDRLNALGSELQQGIRYVEQFLGGLIPDMPEHAPPVMALDSSSPKEVWERFGADLKQRLTAAKKLAWLLTQATAPHA